MKLNFDDADLLRDSKDTLKVVEKILENCLERHKEKLMSEPLEELVHLRLRVEGMKVLLNDFRKAVKDR